MPILLLIPSIVLVLVLVVPVFVYLIKDSLVTGDPLLGFNSGYAGLSNFVSLVTSGSYWVVWARTLGFTLVALVVEVILGMLLALLMSRRRWGSFLSIFVMLPLATEPAISALVGQSWFSPSFGIVDYYLMKFHITTTAIQWLSHTDTAFVVLLLVNVWQWTPLVAIILLGGVMTISPELYQSAAVDGASGWQTFWTVSLPSLWPFLSVAVLLRFIDLFKTYALVNTLTGGGPGNSTVLMSLSIYQNGFEFFQIGIGAAESLLMLVMVSIFVALMYKVLQTLSGGRPFEL